MMKLDLNRMIHKILKFNIKNSHNFLNIHLILNLFIFDYTVDI